MTGTETRVNGIDASYYFVQEMKRAVDFYTALLGTEPTMKVADVVTEWTFPDGETFGLYQPGENEGGFRPRGGLLFNVDDVAVARDAAKARGVTFHGEIEDTPTCHMAFGVDSEGNGFILHHRKES
jgi:predicted enzyme related to lactoylglutathione lyase